MIALCFTASLVQANSTKYKFDIPVARLDVALSSLAQQSDTPLLFSHEAVQDVQSNPVVGHYTVHDALAILLNNTGITGNINNQGVLTVMRADSELNERDNMKSHKKRLTGLAAVLAVLLGSPGAVQAQDGGGDILEEVVVTGIRGSLQQSLAVKRNSPNFVDAITAEDIGKFPDINLGDSLSRIPGVTIERGFDGIPSNVSVRGVGSNFTLALVNGNTISTVTGQNRSFDFGIMASELIGSVDVNKTVNANIQEGGIGGTINVKLREPLDREEGLHGVFSGQAAYDDLTEDTDPRLSGLVSWKNASGTFGVLGSYSSFDFVRRTDGMETFGYVTYNVDNDGDGVADGDTVLAPNSINFILGTSDIKRTGISLSAQLRPSDNFEVIGTFLRAEDDRFVTNLNATFVAEHVFEQFAGTPLQNVQLDANGNFLSGEQRFRPQAATGPARLLNKTDLYSLKASYDDGLWSVDTTLSYNESIRDLRSGYSVLGTIPEDEFVRFRIFREGNRIAGEALEPDFDFAETINGVVFGTSIFQQRTNEELTLAMDFERQLGGVFFSSVEFGTKFRNNDYRNYQSEVYPQNYAAGVINPDYDFGFNDLPQLNFPGYNSRFSGPGRYPDRPFYDSRALYNRTVVDDFEAIDPLPGNTVNNYTVNEQTLALYGQLNLDAQLAGLPLRGNVGLRYVSQSRDVDSVISDVDSEFAGGRFSGFRPINETASTNFLLPSVNLVLELREDLQARFAAGQTVIFPSYDQLNSSISISADQRTATAGSPDLEPFESTGLDLGLEWFPAPDVAVFGTLFYKDYDAFPTTVTGFEDLSRYGTTNPLCCEVSRATSDGSGEVSGVELGIQGNFFFLPGIWQNFGGIVNATFVDGELDGLTEGGDSAVIGQSDTSYNITLYYEDERLSTRANYTYRGEFVSSTITGTGSIPDQKQADVGRLDFSASYDIWENITITFDAVNLTEATAENYRGNRSHPTYSFYSGRRFLLGARYVF